MAPGDFGRVRDPARNCPQRISSLGYWHALHPFWAADDSQHHSSPRWADVLYVVSDPIVFTVVVAAERRGQKREVRGQMTELRGWRAEIGDQKSAT